MGKAVIITLIIVAVIIICVVIPTMTMDKFNNNHMYDPRAADMYFCDWAKMQNPTQDPAQCLQDFRARRREIAANIYQRIKNNEWPYIVLPPRGDLIDALITRATWMCMDRSGGNQQMMNSCTYRYIEQLIADFAHARLYTMQNH